MSVEVPAGGIGSTGYTNTGLGWNGTHLCNGDFTNSRIVLLTTAITYVSEIILGGSPPANSVQGVAYDTSRSHYWVGHYNAAGSGTIRRYNASGALQQTITTPAGVGGPSGVAYDAANDRVLAIFDDAHMRSYACVGGTLVENVTLDAAFGSGSGTGPDGIALDPTNANILWISTDVVGGPFVGKANRTTGVMLASWLCPQAPEGLVFAGETDALYLACDTAFHMSVPNGNRIYHLDAASGIELTGTDVLAHVFSFDLNTAASSTQLVTGVGFRATALLLFSSGGTPGGAAWICGVGCADFETRQWAISCRSNDNVASSAADKFFSTSRCISATNGAGAEQLSASLTRMDHDGFTLSVSNPSTVARRVHVLALAGDALRAHNGTFDLATGAGTQAVTGVGFTPKAVLCSNNLSNITEGAALEMRLMLGAMTDAAQWVTSCNGINLTTPADEQSCLQTDAVLVRISNSLTRTMVAAFASMDVDGFTLTKGTPPGAALRCGYLALGGTAQYAVGTFTQATSPGNQAVTGVGFAPVAELFASDLKAASVSVTAHSRFMIGAAVSASEQRVVAVTAQDAVNPTNTARDLLETDCLLAISDGGTPTRQAIGRFVSQDADGFTINNTTVDATSRAMAYLAIGTPTGEPEPVPEGPLAEPILRRLGTESGALVLVEWLIDQTETNPPGLVLENCTDVQVILATIVSGTPTVICESSWHRPEETEVWFPSVDLAGAAISLTAVGMKQVRDVPYQIRPRVSAGTGQVRVRVKARRAVAW